MSQALSSERRARGRTGPRGVVAIAVLIAIGAYFATMFSWHQSVHCVRGPRTTDLQCTVRDTVMGLPSSARTVAVSEFRSAHLDHRGKTYYLVVDTATAPVDLAQAMGIGEVEAHSFTAQVESMAVGTGTSANVEGRPSDAGAGWIANVFHRGVHPVRRGAGDPLDAPRAVTRLARCRSS